MVSLNPTSVNIQTIILGNILAIAPEDIIQLAAIGFISMAILLLKWKDLMVTFFDENHARSIGLNTSGLKLLFFTLLAACTVAALQTVGAFLVICLVVTPGATAAVDRPLPAPAGHRRGDWQPDQLFRRLAELLSGRGDRRNYRRRPDATVFNRVRFRAEARPARQPSSRQEASC